MHRNPGPGACCVADPVLARCPFCGAELALWVNRDDVQISHAEPQCLRFRWFCELDGFELVGLAPQCC